MPEKKPSLYDLKKTTFWFALAGIALSIGMIVMVFADSNREWKMWQSKFIEYNLEKTEEELHQAQKAVDQGQIDALNKQIADFEAEKKKDQKQIQAISSELSKLKVQATKARSRYQDLKQFLDSDKYYLEEYQAHGEKEKAEEFQKKVTDRTAELKSAKLDLEKIEAQQEEKEILLAKYDEKQQSAGREITKLTRDVARIQSKIKKLEPNWMKDILNAPMLDFINPSLRIQQIVVENLHDDMYFAKVQKVDRCITCHLGIDQKGFEKAPQPFTTHPNLDLFLASNSSHPMEEFGCTVCHGGSGHSVGFTTAAHTPSSETQAKEWKKKYHWHPMKHWSEKMLPSNYVEASCAKCHTGVVNVPEAPKLNEGRELAQEFGCFGCHKVDGFNDRWKVGPGLEHIQSKLEPDWIMRWLHNPKEFRPSTRMPQIFHLTNTSDPASREKNDAAIAGITTYLIKNSDPVTLQSPPVQGDPKEGEKLINEIGCLGCHTVGSMAASNFGPELSSLGSKVNADWLYTWLKDPKHYYSKTRMPNMRLSDQEASNIASYLLSQKNEKFDSTKLPLVKPEAVDDLALTFMTGQKRYEEAKADLDQMSSDERLEFVGKQMIAQQGCFGCHDIKGFETSKPIGTDLSEEGSKEVSKFYFGFTHLNETRQDWFFQKLKDPRIFDTGKVLPYHEKLRMPQFDFTDQQVEALVTFLLSLQKTEIPMEMQDRLSETEQQIQKGSLLVTQFNCQGCHTLDGKVGAVRSIIEDAGNAPPILDGEGAKVQSEWLYQFLENPTPIRPWLHYRMPTFGFDDEQLTAFVNYFNGLSDVKPDYKVHMPHGTPEELAIGQKLFQDFQCIKCHQSNPDPSLSASFLAPDLVMAKTRLRPQWILDWLKDPQVLQAGTMMPGFFPDGQTPFQDILGGDSSKQIKAIRDYLMVFTPEEADKIAQQKVKA